MTTRATIYIHAEIDGLAASVLEGLGSLVLKVGTYQDDADLALFIGGKTATLAALARWTELVQALPDDEVTA